MTAFIGYRTIFEESGAAITADFTPAAGFELANCYDWKTHSAVKLLNTGDHIINIDLGASNLLACNYIGLVGHNLGDTGATVKLQYSDDDITYTDLIDHTVADNNVLFQYLANATARRYWNVLITGGDSNSIISQISVGIALQLRPINRGFAPPVYQSYTAVNSAGINANYLGRSVRREAMPISINQTAIDPADFRTDFQPFLEHAALKPFFFSWDFANYPGEAVYCWMDKKNPRPVYSHLCLMAVSLNCLGVKI